MEPASASDAVSVYFTRGYSKRDRKYFNSYEQHYGFPEEYTGVKGFHAGTFAAHLAARCLEADFQ